MLRNFGFVECKKIKMWEMRVYRAKKKRGGKREGNVQRTAFAN